MAQDERIARALAIEERRLTERAEVLLREAEPKSLGIDTLDLVKAEIERIRKLVRVGCDLRREMSKMFPELASAQHLNALRDRLHARIDAEWADIPDRLGSYTAGREQPTMWLDSKYYKHTPRELKTEVTRELANIADEVTLGMLKPTPSGSSIVVNITGGIVAGINLGAIAGDMNAAINTFQGPGGEALAQAIKQVTEAVATDTSLSPEARAEAIETLTAITQEAALPPERRKRHLVRSLITRAGSIILKVPQLVEAWNTLQTQITTWFGQTPPGT